MVFKHIERAFNAYQKNFLPIIGALLAMYAIVTVIILIGIMPLFPTFMEFAISYSGTTNTTVATNVMTNTFVSLLFNPLFYFAIVMFVIAMILGMVLQTGLVKVYERALKGKAKWNLMIDIAKKKFWTILGAEILIGLIMMLIVFGLMLPLMFTAVLAPILSILSVLVMTGAIFLIVPLFLFYKQAIVINNKKAIDSVKTSFNFGKKNYFQVLALFFVITILALIVNFIPIIGLCINTFFVAPIGILAYTSLYLRGKKR